MTTTQLRHQQTRMTGRSPFHVTHDVAGLTIAFVNVYFIGLPRAGQWVLVDAGLPMSAKRIIRTAEERFGPGARPQAIILTHGHFDHIGALHALLAHWDCPVYASQLELPYVTGLSAYPPPDPTVGGGGMARSSFLLPRGPFDFGGRIEALPEGGAVPHLPDWRWVYTPGHTAGHISLFREGDRTLIAGDAFVTTKQESLISILTQYKKVNGPPAYFTPDWDAARISVRRLADLQPDVAATGHGLPMTGERLRTELNELADYFDRLAVPAHGRYVHDPARADAGGTTYVPPPVSDPVPKLLIAGMAAGALMMALRRRR